MYDDADPVRGAHIAALRTAKLMTQASLAMAAGLHVGTVKRAEGGKPLSAETAQALCAVLGVRQDGLAPPPVHVIVPEPTTVRADHVDGGRVSRVTSWLSRPLGWRDTGRAAMASGVVLQILAWGWPDDGPWASFELTSLVLFALGCAILSARRCLTSGPIGSKGLAGCALVLSCLAVVMTPLQFRAAEEANDRSLLDALFVYGQLERIVEVREILEPGWDPNLTRWHQENWFERAKNDFSDDAVTPGTLAHRRAERKACQDAFLHAANYDAVRCNGRSRHGSVRGWWKLGRILTGRATIGVEVAYPWDDIVGGEGFDRAKAIFEAHHAGRGTSLEEAAAMDEQARDEAAAKPREG